jgi:hypothetical protein
MQDSIESVPQLPNADNLTGLRQTIDEAAQKLETQSHEIEKAPRRRGRPAGSTDKKPRVPYGSKGKVTTDQTASVRMIGPETSQASMIPMIEGAVRMPFDYFANKTGCEAIRASSDELKPTVEAADQAFRIYFPQLMQRNPKEMALITLGTALIGLTFTKYQIYSDQIAKKPLEQNQSGNNSVNGTAGVTSLAPEPTQAADAPVPMPFYKPPQ